MLFKMLFNIRILQDPLHKRAIKRIDGLKKVTGGKKESAFYKDIAEDVPMHYVAETEFQIQEMGGTERAEAQRRITSNGMETSA